jgi:DNA/RNA endonuclease YhcR with UshA esterase domain
MKVRISTVLSALALVAALPFAQLASAHHSAAQYDFTKTVTVEGKVKHLRVANPHMDLILEVSDARGKHDVSFEGHSANNLYRQGWRKDLVKEGDALTIVIAPRHDGADGGYVVRVTTADGHKF